MSKSRISYHNWIVDIGYDPQVGLKPHTGFNPLVGLKPQVGFDPQAGVSQQVGMGIESAGLEILELDDPRADDIADFELAVTEEAGRVELVRQAVVSALESLSSDEREFVVRFHYMGQSYRRISEESGRAIYKLAALHNRAMRKLKAGLAPFVREQYAIQGESNTTCRLCRSPYREEIDRIIGRRDPKSTWRPVIQQLRERFDIRIGSPQLLIGHARYHGGGVV